MGKIFNCKEVESNRRMMVYTDDDLDGKEVLDELYGLTGNEYTIQDSCDDIDEETAIEEYGAVKLTTF